MRTRYEIVVVAEGVGFAAGVNDAPVARGTGGGGQSVQIPVDWWLMGEDDALTVRVTPCDGVDARLDLGFFAVDDRATPIAALRWRWPGHRPAEPFRMEIPVAAAVSDASPQQFEVLEDLDDESVAAIRRLAGEVVAAFTHGDIEAALGLLALRRHEFCRAFDDDPDRHHAGVRDDLRRLLGAPGAHVLDVDLQDLRFDPCCGGRVFHVATRDGSELITIAGGASSASMQVYVARVGGAWRVVR
jgi:hypothetical protein